ncbi:MAG: hypothetical protein FD121_386 [Gallionellaceae bacterium]|nr:MAG: hypothetical protein FD121_386 [Gallionellaceae bacterium]
MNNRLITGIAVSACLFSTIALSAPGEYWEITSKMEMPGMPFAMPATTTKVCIAKGGERDPGKTTGDKDCQASDVKTVGNKTSWKVRCDHDGEIMTGSGEQTYTANGYQGKMRFSGKSHGRDMDMSSEFSGKRIGGSCDSEEAVKKAKADQQKIVGQMCDTSQYRDTADWIYGSHFILQAETPCPPALRNQLCEKVRKDAPSDAKTYNALVNYEQQKGVASVAKECKLNIAATTKAICKTLNGKNHNQLSAHCPAEAKAYREVQRRKDCEGRSYTAETRAADLKRCLSGKEDESSAEDDTQEEAPAPRKASKPANGNPAADALEGAKKLKGLFGL